MVSASTLWPQAGMANNKSSLNNCSAEMTLEHLKLLIPSSNASSFTVRLFTKGNLQRVLANLLKVLKALPPRSPAAPSRIVAVPALEPSSTGSRQRLERSLQAAVAMLLKVINATSCITFRIIACFRPMKGMFGPCSIGSIDGIGGFSYTGHWSFT